MPAPAPLLLVLEFARVEQSGDPYGFRFEPQEYLLRSEGGTFTRARFSWDAALLAELAAVRRHRPDPELIHRLGRLLRHFLAPTKWATDEDRLIEALKQRRRVMLTIRSAAAELYALPWELLTLESTGQHVGGLPGVLLRYEWPGIQSIPESEPRPRAGRILLGWSAAAGAVPAAEHIAALRKAGGTDLQFFDPERNVVAKVSCTRLSRALKSASEQRCPIVVLHLLCHGGKVGSTFGLALDSDDGADGSVVVDAERLGQLLAPYASTLRLVVLAACDSGDSGELGNQLGSMAQMLHRAGIAAVVASRYPLSVSGSIQLAETLYDGLLAGRGSLEYALLGARQRLAENAAHFDWASLQLYARAQDGSDTRPVFLPSRLVGGGSELSQWKALCQCVLKGRFTPILGPDLDENLFGGVGELAMQLATASGWPNADYERSNLAKVVQFLSIQKDRTSAHKSVQTELVKQIVSGPTRGAKGQNSGSQNGMGNEGLPELPKLLDAVVEQRRANVEDPYVALSQLPASIYITASPETMLFKTVKAAGKNPEALYCRWRPTRTNTPHEPREKTAPTPETPLVYHVFGVFGVPESLVLTEDDYFDFLIATSTYKLMPATIRGWLTNSALLFLGFRLDDWTFRVLFRLIMALEGSAGMRQYSHVGVQINPKEHSLADVERARSYLERYFGSDRGAGLSEPPIALYWGSPADFLKELRWRLDESRAEEAVPAAEAGDNEWF